MPSNCHLAKLKLIKAKENEGYILKEAKKQNSVALRPSYWACVSGGKDSLYMLNLILHNLDKYPLTGVLHYELEIDYPFIKDVVDYMESECAKHGIPFIRKKPSKSWYDLYEKNGFPNQITRWCNSKYKLDAARQVKKELASKGFDMISYIGYCADEIKRYEKRNIRRERYPLVEEGIEESTILEWAKTVPVFNDYYKFNKRCGCMWCPLTSMGTLAYLLHYYPDKYEEMMRLVKKTEKEMSDKLGRPFSVFRKDGTQAECIDKRVREKHLSKLLEKLSAQQISIDELIAVSDESQETV